MAQCAFKGEHRDHHRTTGTPADAETHAAVEAQMGKILIELGGALGVLLTALGTRSGLWSALAGAGPLTVDQVAAQVTVDRALVREWLRAQAAGGYLEYDPDTDRFTLPDAVAGAIVNGPGGPLIDAAATMMSSMGEGFGDFSAAFSTGHGYGWHQRTAEHWHGTDAFTKVALPTELIAGAISEITDVATVLRTGGEVVDVGCGYGGPTRAIASLYPAAQVLGIDYHDASIAHARAESAGSIGTAKVRGGRRHRPARQRLRPDHLLRLPARHRRPPRRPRPGPGRGRLDRGGVDLRTAQRRQRAGQPQPDGPHARSVRSSSCLLRPPKPVAVARV